MYDDDVRVHVPTCTYMLDTDELDMDELDTDKLDMDELNMDKPDPDELDVCMYDVCAHVYLLVRAAHRQAGNGRAA